MGKSKSPKRNPSNKMPKKWTTDEFGKRCSGYGVYPNGRVCSGCSDCKR